MRGSEGIAIHVVRAPRKGYLAVATDYVPSPEEWNRVSQVGRNQKVLTLRGTMVRTLRCFTAIDVDVFCTLTPCLPGCASNVVNSTMS
jgi:hypothetical protein